MVLEAVAVAPWLRLRAGGAPHLMRLSIFEDHPSLEGNTYIQIYWYLIFEDHPNIYPNIWRTWEKEGKCLTLRSMQKDRKGESANKAGNITTYDAHHPQSEIFFKTHRVHRGLSENGLCDGDKPPVKWL